ncbi:MAG TPA: hypothetical protein VGK22_12640 [Candidatus Angelobacter sp.]|jgi:hypothetical protein
MTTEGWEANKAKFYAGFYLRTRSRMRFWGWGAPPAEAEVRTTERPWEQLADWLRMAHSLGKPDRLTHSGAPVPSLPEQKDSPARSAKRGFRFVCNRSFVGLVIR